MHVDVSECRARARYHAAHWSRCLFHGSLRGPRRCPIWAAFGPHFRIISIVIIVITIIAITTTTTIIISITIIRLGVRRPRPITATTACLTARQRRPSVRDARRTAAPREGGSLGPLRAARRRT
eukprot:6108409-Pyramimonas_sp.AAC.1